MMKKENFGFVLLVVLALILAGCMSDVPSPLATPQELIARLHPSETATLPPALTATPEPSATVTPRPSATCTPTITPTRTTTSTRPPGEDVDLLFLVNGSFYQYSLRTWTATRLFDTGFRSYSAGGSTYYDVSPDGQWLAYSTKDKQAWARQAPFDGDAVALPVNSMTAFRWIDVNFSPDGNYLALMDGEGYKLLKKPFTGDPIIIHKFGSNEYASREDEFIFSHSHPTLFNKDSQSLIYHVMVGTEEGIFLYDIPDNSTSVIMLSDGAIAVDWSPDKNWLKLITVGFYNYSFEHLYHIPSNTDHKLYACFTLGTWGANGFTIPITRNIWDYRSLCDSESTHLTLITTDSAMTSRVIYSDPEKGKGDDIFFQDLLWNAGADRLYFTKLIAKAESRDDVYLMVYDPALDQVQNLVQFKAESYAPITLTENEIFYINQGETAVELLRFDLFTEEKTKIATLMGKEFGPLAVIGGTDWLVGTADTRVYLVNTVTGVVFEVPLEDGNDLKVKYMGVIP